MNQHRSKLSPTEYLAELRKECLSPPSLNMPTRSPSPDLTNSTTASVVQILEPLTAVEPATPHQIREGASGEHSQHSPGTPSPFASAAMKGNPQLTALLTRVNHLLTPARTVEGPFVPKAPENLIETGLITEEIERLILKFLLARGNASGRQISAQLHLSFQVIEPLLRDLKQDQLVAFKGTTQFNDFDYIITELGRERARRYAEECTYFGSAPVILSDYIHSISAQTIAQAHATFDDLKRAFSDLIINQQMFDRLGPAINSGRGMFLFGEPGNGKTSIAERITSCFGSTIWIPRSLSIDGDIVRLFDPAVHQEVPYQNQQGLMNTSSIDTRWVHIRRPTVIAGGELTMEELEVRLNKSTNVCESPLQLKSNCGTLVIDDFGRQRMPVDVLLNRWIVPLEKRYDFLNLPSGKKIQVPFDQLIIFSTNLEPKDLVDGAFLRRIPYKIEVPDPSESEYRELIGIMANKLGFPENQAAIDHLVENNYKKINRPFRACQPRDLLLQVKNYCLYKSAPMELSPEAFDFACDNYFSVL